MPGTGPAAFAVTAAAAAAAAAAADTVSVGVDAILLATKSLAYIHVCLALV
jgi:hypothetical protein